MIGALVEMILGAIVIGGCITEFKEILEWEQSGGSYQINRIMAILYYIGGKWLVTAPFGLIGGFFFFDGLRRFIRSAVRKRKRTEKNPKIDTK